MCDLAKRDEYREILQATDEWESFLLAESGLPGPRANLELAQAVADQGDFALFGRLTAYSPDDATTNSPHVFLVVCGIIGMGRLASEGQRDLLLRLRVFASDPRWRVREAVAMALQRIGDADMDALLAEAERWADGTALEQRAAAAAVCEPRLLRNAHCARRALAMLDRITKSLSETRDRRSDDFKTLRKGLGYCWSVAVAALPEAGMPVLRKWLASDDHDVQWIMRQNLKKKRLARVL